MRKKIFNQSIELLRLFHDQGVPYVRYLRQTRPHNAMLNQLSDGMNIPGVFLTQNYECWHLHLRESADRRRFETLTVWGKTAQESGV